MQTTRHQDVTTNPTTTFQHAPLDHTKASIRLLRILPELSDTGLIQCEIWHDTTDATYDCLSYVWGSEEDQQEVLINHKLFRVRKNLWDFMEVARAKYLVQDSTMTPELLPQKGSTTPDTLSRNGSITRRSLSRWWRNRNVASTQPTQPVQPLNRKLSRTFWIDAVSIDQSSISERNHQVAQMGLIYSKAVEVIAWLGANDAIARALVFCNELAVLENRPFGSPEIDVGTFWCERDVELDGQLTRDFESFSGSIYWTRAWITQEVLLARKVTMLANDYECGPEGMLQLKLCGFPWLYRPFESTARLFISYIEAVCGEGIVYPDLLVYLLRVFDGRECMIPRDQIYSLVSVASDARTMPIDYGGTPNQFLDQILRTVEHSLCLCSWLRIAGTLNLSSFCSDHIYTEPTFRIRMRYPGPSGHCKACGDLIEGPDENLSTCVAITCGRAYYRHYQVRKHRFGLETTFTLQRGFGGSQIELVHVESKILHHSLLKEYAIYIYVKATVLIEFLVHEELSSGGICSNAAGQNGCMTIYRGAPFRPKSAV